jgi:protein-S-isoprenylcysteine O-methyltransferase Ste14
MDLRQRLFQLRSYIPIPLLFLGVVLGKPTERSVLVGIVVAIAGEALRLWGVAHTGSETRTTDTVGGSRLVTTGPFAHVRNPLYMANVIIYTGVGVMTNIWWLTIAGFVFFSVQYALIVSLEEDHLTTEFGEEYERYTASVPRFFPAFKKFAEHQAQEAPPDWLRGLRSEKSSLIAIACVMVFFAARVYIGI